ncbi:MAG: hypothetical protein EZS28_053465, partial [Streblomastix strix]
MISAGKMNLSEYMKGRRNTQQTMGKEQKGTDQTKHFWRQKRKRNRVVVTAVVISVTVAVTVTATASKYKKTGQGRELRQLREQTETRTGWRMMNATDKQR